MNWRLILSLSALGLFMGILSVLGLIPAGWEGPLWLIIALTSAFVIGRSGVSLPLWHGFLVGLIGGTLAPAIQSAFFPAYLANNPEIARQFEQLPAGWLSENARWFALIVAPVKGLGSGTVLGLMSLLAARNLISRRTPG